MNPIRRVLPMLVGVVAIVVLGAACSVKASIGTDETTTTTTKAETTTTDAGSATGVPEPGTTEQIGDYTLTMVDPSEAGLPTPQGATPTVAALISKAGQPVGLMMQYTFNGSITDDIVKQSLSESADGGSVAPVTINGKQAYAVTLASGQVLMGRATEEGAMSLAVGADGVTQDELGQAIAEVTGS